MLSQTILTTKAIGFSLLLTCTMQVKADTRTQTVYQNETAIEFSSNKGETTDAFEGYFTVKENRNVANSKDINVHYVRFPSTSKNPGAPIVYLSGGPGGSGIATAKWRRFPLFMAMREFGDVIALDQRGTGKSETAPRCTSSQLLPLTQRQSKEQIADKYRKAAFECQQFWQAQGYDLLGYTTAQNALDLDDLRRHLNAEQISLWGISYGSHLAFAAMKAMEQRIDKVIVASAEGLDQTVKLPARTDQYFSQVQDIINQRPELAKRFPDVKKLMRQVHKQLDADPILVDIPQKEAPPLPMLFQKQHMQGLAAMTISDPGQYLSLLLNLYADIANGGTDMLVNVLKRGMFSQEAISFRLMPFAMDIASGISDARLTQVNRQAQDALLGEMLNFPMPMLNKVIPGLDLGDDYRGPITSDIPTLLLTGTLDGRTYPVGQQEATQALTNVTQVLVENAGHNLYMASPKVLQAMQQFMRQKPINEKVIKLPLPKL